MIIDSYRAGIGGVVFGSYDQQVMMDNPIGYWRFDESSGTAAADSSGNENDVVFSGTPVRNEPSLIVDGIASVKFNSSGVILGSQLPDLGNVNRTYEAWVVIAGSGEQRIFDWQDSAGFYVIRVTNAATGAANFQVNTPGGEILASFTIPADEAPHHVVAVRDTNQIRVYVDGELKAQQSATGASGSGTARAIGRHRTLNQNHWNGWMDEIAIYDYALSAGRIAIHYAIGAG